LNPPVPSFRDLGVSADIAGRLADRGITEPFPVQAATLKPALAGRDVCGKAPTGSGKTLAFGIPVVERVGEGRHRRPRALILAPTRELAAQIEAELKPLAKLRKRSVASFYGGVGFGKQLDALKRGVDIAVACPGRLADLVQRRDISLEDVDLVVVDEADRMADMGFLPEVKRLLDQVQPDRQTLLFSATLDGDVDVLVRRYQHEPVRHEVVATEEHEDRTEHLFWKAEQNKRVDLTARLVRKHGSTIVFCRTKRRADRLTRQLGQAGVSAAAIHGDRTQPQRERALASFSGGRVEALVATDVAARGIHVTDVACVVHFDLPGDDKDYVHRSGRTGRAGATGTVVTLVGQEQQGDAKKLQRRLGFERGTHQPDEGRLATTPLERRSAPTAAPKRRPKPKAKATSRHQPRSGHGGHQRRAGSTRPAGRRRSGRRAPR
jgi:superfamily II DNA/RNA helicase